MPNVIQFPSPFDSSAEQELYCVLRDSDCPILMTDIEMREISKQLASFDKAITSIKIPIPNHLSSQDVVDFEKSLNALINEIRAERISREASIIVSRR